jgi:hypothetical protein
MRVVPSLFVILVVALMTSTVAQRRPLGTTEKQKTVGVAIAMKVDGASYNFNGQAVCEHLAKGSIYDTPAERWSVRHDEKGRNVNLTLWRPLTGVGDMATLAVSIGGKSYNVGTVRGPRAPQPAGSVNVKFARQGSGGAFTIDARTASGASLSGAIKCDAFTAPEIVAGN